MRRKLNAMPAVFEGKQVLLVDDSIVRGTTMSQIVEMVRRAGATKVRRLQHAVECFLLGPINCQTGNISVMRAECCVRELCAGQVLPRCWPTNCYLSSFTSHLDGILQVYLASASPPVRFPNVYGVDLPTRAEFVASDLEEQQVGAGESWGRTLLHSVGGCTVWLAAA